MAINQACDIRIVVKATRLVVLACSLFLTDPGLCFSSPIANVTFPSNLNFAIQSGLNQEAVNIARAYFIQMGDHGIPEDVGFQSEVFLVAGNDGAPVIERVMMTAYVPDSYPDGMVIDFRTNFRKYFEEQGYQVVFGPMMQDANPTMDAALNQRPVFDLRFRRTALPVDHVQVPAEISVGDAVEASIWERIQNAAAPFWTVVGSKLDQLDRPGKSVRLELSIIAGAAAAVAFVILVMLALAPMRIMKRRQMAKMRHRQYPAAAKVRGILPPRGEPAVFQTEYATAGRGSFNGKGTSQSSGVDPEVERIRSTMAQLGIKEVLEILKNLDPHYRNQVLNGLNVHQSIKSRIEKALSVHD